MKEIIEIVCWIFLGVLASSFICGIIIHQHEIGHRNFEYVQCKQFWELAINTNRTQESLFDCDLILEEGVLEFTLVTSDNSFNRDMEINYAYQEYVNGLVYEVGEEQ